jgi:hypothetical protein
MNIVVLVNIDIVVLDHATDSVVWGLMEVWHC